MRTFIVFVILGIVPCVLGYNRFFIRDCTNTTNRILSLEDARVYPHPVTIPGNVYPSGTVTVLRPSHSNYRLDVVVQKFFFYDYLTIPCVGRVGSCSYNYCAQLDWFQDRDCPWQLRISGIPCTCPIMNATYHLPPYAFYIYPLNRAWQWLALGDYRVNGRLTDMETGEEIACYDVQFSIQQKREEDDWWNWWSK